MSMTLEEAVATYEQYALDAKQEKLSETYRYYTQLAAWLRELAERRKADSCEGCIFEGGSFLRCMKCKRYKKYYDRYEAGVGTDET